MAGNYEYPSKICNSQIVAWNRDSRKWKFGLFECCYIHTYLNGMLRLRLGVSSPFAFGTKSRWFSLKSWGKDGYK